jgi:hypothetical protein
MFFVPEILRDIFNSEYQAASKARGSDLTHFIIGAYG